MTEEELGELGEDERQIYELVKASGEMPQDLICAKLGKDPMQVASILSVLEIKGFVDFSMGKVMAIKF